MDFVIVGIVIGAVLVGAGALLRDLGPRLRPRLARPTPDDLKPDALALAWTRFCHSIGMVVTALGFVLVLATVTGFIGNVNDGLGWSIVGIGSALALAGSMVSVVLISRHYQRGGFDPQSRAETPAEVAWELYSPEPANLIVADQTIPLSSQDVFAFTDSEPTPAATTMTPSDAPEPSAPVDRIPPDEPVPDDEIASVRDDSASLPDPDESLAEPNGVVGPEVDERERVVAGESQRDIPILNGPEQLLPVAFAETGDVPMREASESNPSLERHWQPLGEPITDPELIARPDPMTALASFDPPLIDLNEELPAWDAPPVERVTFPLPYEPVSEVGGAFESSLLADLGQDASPESAGGPFQSRLLNDLTASGGDPAAAGQDVLIAESPADSGRGARQE